VTKELCTWALIGVSLTVVLVWLVKRGRGARDLPLRIADWLTIARLILIAPIAWLLSNGHFLPAAILYVVLGVTDVADGVIARRRGETSAFGMFLDPVADILSTTAIFTVFVCDGLIPRWLYAALLLRYVPLGIFAVVYTRTAGPVDFTSTVPGKVVGLVQAGAALWIMLWAARGVHPAPGSGPLFAFLAIGFVSIVVSQTVIGYRHVRAHRRARG
jgi:cardiolipin synthase